MNFPLDQLSQKRSAEFIRPARPMSPSTPLRPNREIRALLLTLFLPLTTAASELPREAPLTKYQGLWTNSPFTSRPIIVAPEAPPEVNPLEDYALVGVSPVAEGFRVTLINRNDPGERIIVDSSRPNPKQDIKILGIDRQPGRPLSTTVKLSMGRSTGTIGFEQELLTLTPPPAAAPPQRPGINPADGQPDPAQGARRQPRPRVVPPPANAQQAAAQQQQQQGSRQQRIQGARDRAERSRRR